MMSVLQNKEWNVAHLSLSKHLKDKNALLHETYALELAINLIFSLERL